MKNEDTIKIKRESVRIWLGVGLAVFGCILILIGIIIPPAGIVDGSILTATGEIFGLSGGCIGVFAMSRRDNAKIDYLYDMERRRYYPYNEEDNDIKQEEDETIADKELQ